MAHPKSQTPNVHVYNPRQQLKGEPCSQSENLNKFFIEYSQIVPTSAFVVQKQAKLAGKI